MAEPAAAARPLSLREQANMNARKERRPHIAEKQLKQIEAGPSAEEQKQQARQRAIDKQIDEAETAKKAADRLGSDEQKTAAAIHAQLDLGRPPKRARRGSEGVDRECAIARQSDRPRSVLL